jgi:hypothetical protein
VTKAHERALGYQRRVKVALAEANAAARAAAAEYKKTAKKSPVGFVLDACGDAWIVLYKPKYHLREALKALGAITNRGGQWRFTSCPPSMRSQSITANEKAVRAACEALKHHFPGEGEFLAIGRID